jgi:hypothetical protein
MAAISTQIRPTFCRNEKLPRRNISFRFSSLFKRLRRTSGSCIHPFPVSSLSSSTYEAEPPTRLEVVCITFHLFPFSNSFRNVDLMDFLEVDSSSILKPGHRTHGATQLAPPCPSINAPTFHLIMFSRLTSVLIRPQRFHFHDKVFRLDAAGGRTPDDRT